MKIDLSKDGRTKPSPCPHCGKVLDAICGPDTVMRDGDVSICIKCGEFLEMQNGELIRMTEDTLGQIIASPDDSFERMMAMARAVRDLIEQRTG